ncbi:protein transporter tim9 [Basidiobolus ranarum]|uniref:Mitochondrial import inner membrane translocase subunit n=1 Tax=Basidiobolus ranarum TaxID=34480 RepID=A0ABR2VND4_9FUNG
MDFSQFSPAERSHMEQLIQQKQMKDFMRLYTGLVQRCFETCAHNMKATSINADEETCVNRCIDKFMKHSERVGQRFAEQNALLTQQLNEKQK